MEQEFEITLQEDAHDGFLKLKRHTLRHTSFEGGWCGEIVRERLEDLASVSVLLFDPDLDEMVFVEQFRIGLVGSSEPPWCLETVSGFCDRAHETPEEVARREVVEETGCELLALTRIGEFYVSPGISVERLTLYCGSVDASRAEGVHGLEHEGEEMRVVRMPRHDAEAALFGRLNSTSVIMAMQWFMLNRERLLRVWETTSA